MASEGTYIGEPSCGPRFLTGSMGQFVISRHLKAMGWLAISIMLCACIGVFVTWKCAVRGSSRLLKPLGPSPTSVKPQNGFVVREACNRHKEFCHPTHESFSNILKAQSAHQSRAEEHMRSRYQRRHPLSSERSAVWLERSS
jgi:hypothetical protein